MEIINHLTLHGVAVGALDEGDHFIVDNTLYTIGPPSAHDSEKCSAFNFVTEEAHMLYRTLEVTPVRVEVHIYPKEPAPMPRPPGDE